jgi:hypothetical protein
MNQNVPTEIKQKLFDLFKRSLGQQQDVTTPAAVAKERLSQWPSMEEEMRRDVLTSPTAQEFPALVSPATMLTDEVPTRADLQADTAVLEEAPEPMVPVFDAPLDPLATTGLSETLGWRQAAAETIPVFHADETVLDVETPEISPATLPEALLQHVTLPTLPETEWGEFTSPADAGAIPQEPSLSPAAIPMVAAPLATVEAVSLVEISVPNDTQPQAVTEFLSTGLHADGNFSDTLSGREQDALREDPVPARWPDPVDAGEAVPSVQGVNVLVNEFSGGTMADLSGYKDLSRAPMLSGDDAPAATAPEPKGFPFGALSAPPAAPAPAPAANKGLSGFSLEHFAQHGNENRPPIETEFSGNVQTLIRLVSELPEGVTKQTGAQIIRLTMEAMGISMEEVLSEAQAAQTEMLDAVRANIKKIEEFKTVIRKLEADIKYYQGKANELSEIIDLFILSNASGNRSVSSGSDEYTL